MVLKRVFLALLCVVLAVAPSVAQQPVTATGLVNAATTDCSVTAGCVTLAMSPNNGAVAVRLSGTFTATQQFEGTVDGTTWAAVTGIPISVGTGVTSATAAGTWQFSTSGLSGFRVRTSAYTSGGAQVTIQSSLGSVPQVASTASVTSSVKIDQTTPGTTNGVSVAQIGATTVLNGGTAGSLGVGGISADGATATGTNPVLAAGVDVSGNKQTICTSTDGVLCTGLAYTGADTVSNSSLQIQEASDGNGRIPVIALYGFNGTTWDRYRTGSATSTDPHFGALENYNAGGAYTLQASGNATSTTTGTAKTGVGGFHQHILDFNVTAAERDSANETYDVYIQMGDGVTTWDVAHFPQIASTGAKTYVAVVNCDLLPQTITTAGPGVSAVRTGTMKTDTGGSNEGTRTLTAGMTQHGVCGDRIRYDVVVAGTIGGTGLTFSITDTVR